MAGKGHVDSSSFGGYLLSPQKSKRQRRKDEDEEGEVTLPLNRADLGTQSGSDTHRLFEMSRDT